MRTKIYLVSFLLLVSKFASATLTATEKTNILNKHNDLRGAIATPCTATDMETLVDKLLRVVNRTGKTGTSPTQTSTHARVGGTLI